MFPILTKSSESDRPLARPHLIPPIVRERGPHRLRFARTEADLDAVRRLRFQVFNLELGEGLDASYLSGKDEDQFDAQCQHLMVEHAADGVVGTYRLQVAETAMAGEGFYSASEYDFSALPNAMLMASVEAGRACVAKGHRDKPTLYLLWCGLIAYLKFHNKKAFFGCSSLTSQDPAEGLRFYDELEADGHVHPEYRVTPLPGFTCLAKDTSGPKVEMPKLFGMYLRHGARVLGPPAIDREFGTIDYLIYVEATRRHFRLFGSP
ncbi:MAG: putative hemolysin [Planctomycetota bacterium]